MDLELKEALSTCLNCGATCPTDCRSIPYPICKKCTAYEPKTDEKKLKTLALNSRRDLPKEYRDHSERSARVLSSISHRIIIDLLLRKRKAHHEERVSLMKRIEDLESGECVDKLKSEIRRLQEVLEGSAKIKASEKRYRNMATALQMEVERLTQHSRNSAGYKPRTRGRRYK